jgi:hypothetical protein
MSSEAIDAMIAAGRIMDDQRDRVMSSGFDGSEVGAVGASLSSF